MNAPQQRESAPTGFDAQGWPLPEVRSMMIDNFVRSWTWHWMAVVLLFVISIGLVLFGAWLVTPTWEGQATMEIHATPSPSLSLESGATTEAAPLTAAQLVKNLIEQTRSLSFLREVVIRSELDKHLQARADQPPDLRMKIKKAIAKVGTLQFLRGRPAGADYVAKGIDELTSTWLSITPSEGATVIPIYVYGDTHTITKKVGDTIMDLLQERTDAALRAGVERQVGVLEELIRDAETRVAANDAAMKEARTKYQFFDPETYARQAQDTAQSLQNEKSTFRPRADSLQAELATLSEQLLAIPETRPLVRDSEALRADPQLSSALEKEIAGLRADIAAKSQSLGPNSPAVKSLQVRLETMQKSLDEARLDESKLTGTSTNTVETLDPRHQALYNRWVEAKLQLTALEARFASLDEAISAMTAMQHQAVAADIELKRLQRESIADEEQLKQLVTQRRQLQNLLAGPRLFTGVVSRTDTQVLNEKKSDYPNMLLAAILALAIGVFAALVLPIAYDYLNQTLLTSRQVSAIPGMRVVAAVPRGGSGKMFASA